MTLWIMILIEAFLGLFYTSNDAVINTNGTEIAFFEYKF